MLPCVCSVIDHRGRQNVVKNKKVAHGAQPSVSWMFLSHFDVICDLLLISKSLLVVYRESVNLVGYITRILSADSLQL